MESSTNISGRRTAESTSGESHTLSAEELQQHLDETVRDSLPLSVLTLALLYVFFALINLAILPPHVAWQISLASAATAAVLGCLSIYLFRRGISAERAQLLVTGVGFLVLMEVLYHLWLRPLPIQAAGLSILMIGAGCILLSRRLLIILLFSAVTGWAAIMLILAHKAQWSLALYLLSSGVVFSLLVHEIRLRTYIRLLTATLYEQEMRRQMEQTLAALQRSESRFRRLIHSGVIGIIEVNLQGELLEANDRFLEIIGRTQADMPLRWDELSPPEWAQKDQEVVRLVRETGVADPWEKEYYHLDGHRVPILVGVALFDEHSEECICFVLDLTEVRQAENRIRKMTVQLERAARLATIGEMIAGLAHELHQPIASSVNFVRALKRRSEAGTLSEEDLLHRLDRIESQLQTVSSLLRNIGDSVGQNNVKMIPCQLRGCIEVAIDLTISSAHLNENQILLDIPQKLPMVQADPIQITQVLFCLLLNAVHAVESLPEENQVVMVSAVMSGETSVRVEVRDNGSGIAPEHMSQIFYQFFSTRPNAPGLGLSISRTVIEAHGSELKAESTPDQGSVFSFELRTAPEQSPLESWTSLRIG